MQLHVQPSTVGATPLRPGPGRVDLEALLRPPAWHADAACREHPELNWFPDVGEGQTKQLAVCSGCLVRDECLTSALDNAEVGVWGGTSGRGRKMMRRAAA